MKIFQAIEEAMQSLTANKLRSGLTILGIVIGVAAVIAMLGIGQGAQASISGSINSIGTNLLFVTSGANGVNDPRPLTQQDAAALASAPDVSAVSEVINGRGTVIYNGKTDSPSIAAVAPGYAQLRSLTTSEGSFIDQTQVSGMAAVAVIGSQTAQNLFGRTSGIVGQVIRINNQPFRVIGLLQSKGGSSFGSQDDTVLIPFTTGRVRLFHRSPANRVDQILVQATSPDKVTAATAEITSILNQKHQTTGKTADFTVLSQQDILNTASNITGVLTLFLGGIGAISLLVGGIGIMNIMLVSVTERTREIGLRKAIGARKMDILVQFLVESSFLSVIGGVIGIALAYGISAIVRQIAANSGTPFSPVIGINAILLATIFSAAVGLFFGFYPAFRASSLAPAEALRSE